MDAAKHSQTTLPAQSVSVSEKSPAEDVQLPRAETLRGTPDSKPDEPKWIKGIALVMVVSAVTLVVFLMLLDVSIVSTVSCLPYKSGCSYQGVLVLTAQAIPHITSEFHSLDDVAWYGSAYTIASASLQPLTGKFYSNFQQKWTFLSFFGVFELGSLICGVATSSKMLIVGRAVAGMGSSGMVNGALNIIASSLPMHRRPTFMGIMMGCE